MTITITEYLLKVKVLFQSRKATPRQWDEMAGAILRMSESRVETVEMIDRELDPAGWELVDQMHGEETADDGEQETHTVQFLTGEGHMKCWRLPDSKGDEP